MLINLIIKNYALIRKLELKPADGLNIITGETGAGKSIMLGAVGLLLGNRADTKALLDSSSKCIIEGTFAIENYDLKEFFASEDLDYEKESIIRREISPAGKSRAFINDTPVTLDVLRSLGSRLMDIHSQHETLLLAKSTFQIDLIDAFAGTMNERKAYQKEFREYRKMVRDLQELRARKEKNDQEADYRHFILQELIDANLQADEQDTLENELEVLENAEEIRTKLSATQHALSEEDYAALNSLRQAQQFLQDIRKFSPEYEQAYARLHSALLELDDLSDEIANLLDSVDVDPEKTIQLQERLNTIYNLQQKHHVPDIAGLIRLRDELDAEVYESDALEKKLIDLENTIDEKQLELQKKADVLSDRRNTVRDELSNAIEELLKKLGMPDAKLVV
ncbi:MAG: DNA repair protein RecN, partial [Cyclobacteriaceae bacterium]